MGGSGCVRTPLALAGMKKVGHSNRISQGDLFTPHLSRLPSNTHLHLGLAWHRWRWVAPKSPSFLRVRLQRRLLTCFNNFLPSSANLCKYFSPVSSSLEGQLRVSVWVWWQLRGGLADTRALELEVKVLPQNRKCYQ